MEEQPWGQLCGAGAMVLAVGKLALTTDPPSPSPQLCSRALSERVFGETHRERTTRYVLFPRLLGELGRRTARRASWQLKTLPRVMGGKDDRDLCNQDQRPV